MNSVRLLLPAKILYEDFGGDWNVFVERLYEVFKADFVFSKPVLPKRVALKKHPLSEEKEATFWHLVTEGKTEADRTPSLRRSECLPWIRPLIENYNAENVRCWEKQHQTRKGPEKRILIALEDFSYIVVLVDRGEYVLPWTAYCVEYESQRNKLKNEFDEFKKKRLEPHSSYDPFTPSALGG